MLSRDRQQVRKGNKAKGLMDTMFRMREDSSSPRKRGPSVVRGKTLGSRLRGNHWLLSTRLRGNDGLLSTRLRGNDGVMLAALVAILLIKQPALAQQAPAQPKPANTEAWRLIQPPQSSLVFAADG